MSDEFSYRPDADFIAFLERVSAQLRTWPAWKRNMIGPALPEDLKAFREYEKRKEGR